MNENFQRHLCGGADLCVGGTNLFNFGDRTFAGQNNEAAAEVAGELNARRARDRHLRRGMNGKIRREMANQSADADILDNCGVDTGGNDRAEVLLGLIEFGSEDERVKRHIPAHAAEMQELHQFWQIADGEIVGAHARVEAFEAEVNGVSAVFDGGFGAFPIAGRGKQLRSNQCRLRYRLSCGLRGGHRGNVS
jgi:hypothetical protein